MNYYDIWISSARYKGKEPLTYSSELTLKPGQVVLVPFQNFLVGGLLDKKVTQPKFATKEIKNLVSDIVLPATVLALFKWLPTYYPAPISSHLQLFLPKSLLSKTPDIDKKTTKLDRPPLLPKLTSDQEAAIHEINKTNQRVVVLHGETGSGKTRVYIELVKQQFLLGKSAIILIPEIGLTPQLFKTLNESLPGQVVIMNSGLTPKERRDNWLRILNAEQPLVVVGPRSSLFTPVNKPGLIVVDEAHESVYKQEQAPHYLATRVAAKLAELSSAKIIFGTATPSVTDYYLMKSKDALVVRMTKSATSEHSEQPAVTVIKISDRAEFNRSHWLSDKLLDSIKQSLENKEQSLVFLNRRGTALLVLCNNCSWQAICPNCDTPLTYHGDSHDMVCHSCSYHNIAPQSCPICHNTDLVFRGVGTKAIESELAKLFPAAKVSRFDKDNKKGEKLDQNYKSLLSGQIDIVVGTQIITKGFDLPKLSTVGIVVADSSLYFPDYTAEEKTFQTIMQIMGRVGRGHRAGRIIIQSYHPDNPVITDAIKKDYKTFYDRQLAERQNYHFPPFTYILKVSCKRASISASQTAIKNVLTIINLAGLPIRISGPSPSFYEKVRGKYVWQLIIRSSQRHALLDVIKLLPTNYSYDIDPTSLL